MQKTPLEIHRELIASGVFEKYSQAQIAGAIEADQGTVSRIYQGKFKRVNRSVVAICKYAQIGTVRSSQTENVRKLLAVRDEISDPAKKKLIDIIELAVDLLERS